MDQRGITQSPNYNYNLKNAVVSHIRKPDFTGEGKKNEIIPLDANKDVNHFNGIAFIFHVNSTQEEDLI